MNDMTPNQRAAAMRRMKKARYTWAEIGEKFDVSPQRAQFIVKQYEEKLVKKMNGGQMHAR
jgi:DNA-directed RNA polymerase sigma subunit (sigma70/sigma32)